MRQLFFSLKMLFLFVAWGNLSCKNRSSVENNSPTLVPSVVKDSFEQINQSWVAALKKGDSVALGDAYSTDAKLMTSGEPSIVGRDNITKVLAKLIREGVTGNSYTTVGLWGSDDLYVQEFIETFSDKDGKEVDHGKAITVWKRENGQWKIFRDIYNSDVPITRK